MKTTKKILSIFLSVLMLATIGVIGVSAETPAEAKAQLAAAFQAAGTADTFGNDFQLGRNLSLADNWGQAVVVWESFAAGTTNTNSYQTLKSNSRASITWFINWYKQNEDGEDTGTLFNQDWVKVTATTITASTKNALGVYFKQYGSEERLYLSNEGVTKHYGKVEVKAVVKVDGTERTSRQLTVELIDQGPFQEILNECKTWILDKEDRYTKDYIKKVTLVYKEAKAMLAEDPQYINDVADVYEELMELMNERKDNRAIFGGNASWYMWFISFVYDVIEFFEFLQPLFTQAQETWAKISPLLEQIGTTFNIFVSILGPIATLLGFVI